VRTLQRGALFCFSAVLLFNGVSAGKSGGDSSRNPAGKVRTYYIAADEMPWDYVPGGMDGITATPFKAVGLFMGGASPGGKPVEKPVPTSYVKALYREYTDNTFHTLRPRSAEWEHLGFMGPLIRAEVGDTIRVVFRNNGQHPYSMHPHGVLYNKTRKARPMMTELQGATRRMMRCLREARTNTPGKCRSGPAPRRAMSTP
jgi:Multicopper oxidase